MHITFLVESTRATVLSFSILLLISRHLKLRTPNWTIRSECVVEMVALLCQHFAIICSTQNRWNWCTETDTFVQFYSIIYCADAEHHVGYNHLHNNSLVKCHSVRPAASKSAASVHPQQFACMHHRYRHRNRYSTSLAFRLIHGSLYGFSCIFVSFPFAHSLQWSSSDSFSVGECTPNEVYFE